MKFKVDVYYKGGGTATYPVLAPNVTLAKNFGRSISMRWEPNMLIKKITAKKIASEKATLHSSNPDKPFGDPFDDTEDLASHPMSAWFV
jgi:hypothetical protein